MSIKTKFLSQLNKAFKPVSETSLKQDFATIDYTIPQIPRLIEKKNDPWVWYGYDNLYPIKIEDLRSGSGIHNSILNTKTKMTAGDGWLINGATNKAESDNLYNALDSNTKAMYDLFLQNPYNKESTLAIKEKCASDLQTHGAMAYEVIFNNDFTKIVRLKYVDVVNIRAGKLDCDEVKTYWYCRNWAKYKVHKPYEKNHVEMFAFDPNDKEHMNQIVYMKRGKGEYYGDIAYKGCLNWIMIDFKMGLYHLSAIDNGMNPGMWFKFYKLPADDTQKQDIIDSLKRAYKGAVKTNEPVISFSESKDVAMDIQPIQTTNLDKQLLLLAELSDKKILTGHQLTSPLLAGISVSGQIGGNTELKVAFDIFDNIAMESDRNFIDAAFQKVLDYNKTLIKLNTNPFNPFKTRIV